MEYIPGRVGSSGLGWGDLGTCPGRACGREEEPTVLGVGRRASGGRLGLGGELS